MNILKLIGTTIIIMSVCGCGGGGGGSGNSKSAPDVTAPEIHLDAVGMQGTLDESATVSVNGIADDDAMNDAVFSVLVPMGSGGMPSDPVAGSSANGSLNMTATDPATNVGGQELELIIHH